jgi:hypothetical protein
MAGPFFDGSFFDGGFFGEGGAQPIPEGPRPNTNEKRRRKEEEELLKMVRMLAPSVFKFFDGKRRG